MRRGRRLGAESMSAWFLSMIESARTTRSLRRCSSSIDLDTTKKKEDNGLARAAWYHSYHVTTVLVLCAARVQTVQTRDSFVSQA